MQTYIQFEKFSTTVQLKHPRPQATISLVSVYRVTHFGNLLQGVHEHMWWQRKRDGEQFGHNSTLKHKGNIKNMVSTTENDFHKYIRRSYYVLWYIQQQKQSIKKKQHDLCPRICRFQSNTRTKGESSNECHDEECTIR